LYQDLTQPLPSSADSMPSYLDGTSPSTHDRWYDAGNDDDAILTTQPQLELTTSTSIAVQQKFVLNVVIQPILYGLITVVGATGNMLFIYVIIAKPRMLTVTNLLLLSLASTDLAFVLVVPPFTAYQNATDDWPFGDVACRLKHYMVNVVAYVTVYTLVVIAALSYATVVHDTATVRYGTQRNASATAATIWAVMLAVNVPILMSYHVVHEDGLIICDIVDAQVSNRFVRDTRRGG